MSNYGNRFKKVLSEKDEISDKEAMQQTLDKGTDPSAFDVEPIEPGSQITPTMGSIQKKMYDDLIKLNNEIIITDNINFIESDYYDKNI